MPFGGPYALVYLYCVLYPYVGLLGPSVVRFGVCVRDVWGGGVGHGMQECVILGCAVGFGGVAVHSGVLPSGPRLGNRAFSEAAREFVWFGRVGEWCGGVVCPSGLAFVRGCACIACTCAMLVYGSI